MVGKDCGAKYGKGVYTCHRHKGDTMIVWHLYHVCDVTRKTCIKLYKFSQEKKGIRY